MANLTLSIDEQLVKMARIKAIQDGTSLSAKVRELLTLYVQGVRAPSASAPPAVPVFDGMGGLNPGIDPTRNRSMLAAAEGDTSGALGADA